MKSGIIILAFIIAAAAAATPPPGAAYPLEIIGGFLGCWALAMTTNACGLGQEPFTADLPDDLTPVATYSLVMSVGMAAGAFTTGELADGPSAAPLKTWGYTTLSLSSQVLGGFAACGALGFTGRQKDWRLARGAAATLAGINLVVAVGTAPVWYHHFKGQPPRTYQDPAPVGKKRRFAVTPHLGSLPSGNGGVISTYGLSISF